jgi:hypothetical protein
MSHGLPSAGIWHPIEYDDAWDPFHDRFDFTPDFYNLDTPVIKLPENSLVVDLAPIFGSEGARFAADEMAINAYALRAFVWLSEGAELLALDWQHPAYRYSPGAHALADDDWAVPVFPNGDYYIHTTPDLVWGTFGHPWQQSLTIWGSELIDSLGAELLTWLPKHRHSP